MGNTLTSIGSPLVRIAYVVLLIVFATTPTVSLAFGDTGVIRQVVDRDAEAVALSPSPTRAVADTSASDGNTFPMPFSTKGASHLDSSSVSVTPHSQATAPHWPTPDRPEASVPEIATSRTPYQNTLAPDAASPDALEPDDPVANDLAPPTGNVPAAAAGAAGAVEAPRDTAGQRARQEEAADAAGFPYHRELDTALNVIASYVGGSFVSGAISRSEMNPADIVAGFLAVPNAVASAKGAFGSQGFNKTANLDGKFPCSETTTAAGRVVVS